MKESHAEKYWGDYISSVGTIDKTIKERKSKAYSYLSEIKALLTDLSFGKRRLEIGWMLRNTMFVNGILYNSEAWHNISMRNIEELEVIDHTLIKFIIGAHAKTPTEISYLETGAIYYYN